VGIGCLDGGAQTANAILSLLRDNTENTEHGATEAPSAEANHKEEREPECGNSIGTAHEAATKTTATTACAAVSSEEAYFLCGILGVMTCFQALLEDGSKEVTDFPLDSSKANVVSLAGQSLRAVPLSADDMYATFAQSQPRFPLKLSVYRYYRSCGWIVRSGVLFGADFVLYTHHPRSCHSAHSVLVLPITPTIGPKWVQDAEYIRWETALFASRVASQVGKKLLLSWVTPPLKKDLNGHPAYTGEQLGQLDDLTILRHPWFPMMAGVKEVQMRRWTAERAAVMPD